MDIMLIDEEGSPCMKRIQAFDDVPTATDDCMRMRDFLQTEFGISDENTTVLLSPDIDECDEAYDDLEEKLQEGSAKKTLIIHVFAGQSAQDGSNQVLLLN